MIQGLLLAGGDSSRMGKEKSRLLIQGEEAWLHLAGKMQTAGCDQIYIGIPAHLLDPLTPLLPARLDLHLEVIPESERQRGPIGSLSHLITRLGDIRRHCLVAPVDHPYVTVDTLRSLLKSEGPIRIPSYKGRRGHPIVLDASIASRVPQLEGTLKTLTRNAEFGAIEVPVPDESIHWNLDRPADYERFESKRRR